MCQDGNRRKNENHESGGRWWQPGLSTLLVEQHVGMFGLEVLHQMTAPCEVVTAHLTPERLQPTVHTLVALQVAALSETQSAAVHAAHEGSLACVSADVSFECGWFKE